MPLARSRVGAKMRAGGRAGVCAYQVRRLEIELAEARAEARGGGAGSPGRRGGPRGDGFGGGGPGRSLREGEDAFLQAERLTDELAAARREVRALQLQVTTFAHQCAGLRGSSALCNSI